MKSIRTSLFILSLSLVACEQQYAVSSRDSPAEEVLSSPSQGGRDDINQPSTPATPHVQPSTPATPHVPQSLSAHFCGGDGSKASPYLICTENQLNAISRELMGFASQYGRAHFRLMNNLDMSRSSIAGSAQTSNFKPLWAINSFDGNNKTIRNLLFVGRAGEIEASFVSYVDGVKNLNFVDASYKLSGNTVLGIRVSGLAGSSYYGDIVNVHFDGLKIEVGNTSGGVAIGGIMSGGNFARQIRDSSVKRLDIQTGTSLFGATVGGLWGSGNGVNILRSEAEGSIRIGASESQASVGGLAGAVNGHHRIQDSHANVRIVHSGAGNRIGGITGGGIGEIFNCSYVRSAVSGANVYGGGIFTVSGNVAQ